MKYQDIYDLSKSFAPPKINLRQGEILDGYGDESFANHPINHQIPDDVTKEDFDYYAWVYPFLNPEDLLFYLYPIIIEFKKDRGLECIDSYLYSLDRNVDDLKNQLTADQNKVLKQALLLVWMTGDDGWADWEACHNLQRYMGLLE